MLPDKINGLPAHILLVHLVIVFVPVAALMLAASALWPAARAKLGFLTPAVALVALVFVPITTHAGHWLQDHLRGNEGHLNPLILRHAQLGEELLPWTVGLFVMAVAVWVLGRRYEVVWRARPTEPTPAAPAEIDGHGGGTATATRTEPETRLQVLPLWVTVLVAVLSLAVAVGSVIMLYRIGEAGSHAVWLGRTTG